MCIKIRHFVRTLVVLLGYLFLNGCQSMSQCKSIDFDPSIPVTVRSKIATRYKPRYHKEDLLRYAQLILFSAKPLTKHSNSADNVSFFEDFKKKANYSSCFRERFADLLNDSGAASTVAGNSEEYYYLDIVFEYDPEDISGLFETRMRGLMRKFPENRLVWRNELVYRTHPSFSYQKFQSVRDVRGFWMNHPDELVRIMRESHAAMADLLYFDLLDSSSQGDYSAVTLKMRSGDVVKGCLVYMSEGRVMVRNANGALVSMPSYWIRPELTASN